MSKHNRIFLTFDPQDCCETPTCKNRQDVLVYHREPAKLLGLCRLCADNYLLHQRSTGEAACITECPNCGCEFLVG